MLQKFYPDRIETSTYGIDFEELYNKGCRGLIFDIDNTLVKHGEDATEDAIHLFKRLKEIGFEVCLMSNNKLERVERFNKHIQVRAIHNAAKPSKKNYIKAMELMGTTKETTTFIGDQLFTDVFGAKRLGIPNILVEPIHKSEEIQIVLKRYLEKIVLHSYEKNKKKGTK